VWLSRVRVPSAGPQHPQGPDPVDTPRFGWRRSSLTRGYSCFLLLPGMLSYCDRYSEGMKRVLKTFGPVPEFSGATAEKVHQVCELLPVKQGVACSWGLCLDLQVPVADRPRPCQGHRGPCEQCDQGAGGSPWPSAPPGSGELHQLRVCQASSVSESRFKSVHK